MNIISKIISFLRNKNYGLLLGILALASLLSLGASLLAQLLGYKPCVLCLYQRIPFIIITLLTAIGLRLVKFAKIAIYLCILSVFANVILSGYHSGVEHGVFDGPEACVSHKFEQANSIEDIRNIIEHTQPVSCKKPALIVFGLSMAEWNFIWNLSLLLLAFLMLKIRRPV